VSPIQYEYLDGTDENLYIVKYYLDGEEFNYNSTDPIKSDSLSEGTHEVKVIAVDVVGNNSTGIFAFSVDKSAPEIEIKSPAEDIKVSNKLSIDLNVNDANLVENEAVTILLPTDQVIIDQTFYEFDTSNLDDGEYQVQISAKDKANNTISKTINFTVDHSITDKTPTETVQTFDSIYYIVIGIAIVAGLAALVFRKKKISKKQ